MRILGCLLVLPLVAAGFEFPVTAPLESDLAEASFHGLDGFEMRLIASEPLVTDPVSITYDEDGRAYVCEMNDYPYTDKAAHKPSQENPTDLPLGKVRLLEDRDGDGVFDHSTVFAEGLSWPTGAVCWNGGVFVCATPDIWYLKDTDGDGEADVRDRVLTGFRKYNVQAVMNHPVWGPDHRIYVAGGSNGASITSPLHPDRKPVVIRRHDFSFDPVTHELRLETGGARFGQGIDDWGNRFLCNIRNPCQHVRLSQALLGSNPFYTASDALVDCAESGDQLPVYRTSPVEPWREFRAKRWTDEGSTLPRSELTGAGVVTSSSGITIYRGDAYPDSFREFAFVADVAGNLFYRMRLEPDGLTFRAVQVDGTANFCTSDDLWSRLVNFVNAPDGCLHVCDMYREVIEHPWSIPDDIHEALDLLRGRDRGRLYRLSPPGFKPHPTPKLSQASAGELVALLDHANGWHRDTAARLLFERQDQAAIDPLVALARDGKTPGGRGGALRALRGLGFFGRGPTVDLKSAQRLAGRGDSSEPWAWLNDVGLSREAFGLLLQASQDPDANVRRLAIRISPGALLAPRDMGEMYEIRQDAMRLLHDSDERVVIEAILAHSQVWSPAVFPEFGRVCIANRDSPQILEAALLATGASSFTMFQEVLKARELEESEPLRDFLCQCAEMMGRAYPKGDPDAPYHVARHLIVRGDVDPLARRVLGSLAAGLRRVRSTLEAAALAPVREHADGREERWLARLLEDVERVTGDPGSDVADRVACLRLTREFFPEDIAADRLGRVMEDPLQGPEAQRVALELAGTLQNDAGVATVLIGGWKSMTPEIQSRVLTLLTARPGRTQVLLGALETETIPRGAVPVAIRAALLGSKDELVVQRARALFASSNGTPKSELVRRYLGEMGGTGDPEKGRLVYESACQACHRHGESGNDVGPHLGTVRAWTIDQLVTNILDPNREVSPNFALCVIETRAGTTISGIITEETETGLTLRLADGSEQTLERTAVASIASPGVSLMPEGLEAVVTPAQMADLVAFLRAN